MSNPEPTRQYRSESRFGDFVSSWRYNWEDTIIPLSRGMLIVEEQMAEYEDNRVAQMHVLASAQYKESPDDDDGIPIILKIRYEYASLLFLFLLLLVVVFLF